MAAPAPERGNSYKDMQYTPGRDSQSDSRNILLVVAALIAGVTFQAGVNPPGGVWQDTNYNHTAGKAIYAYVPKGQSPYAYYVYLIPNTLALFCACQVIFWITCNGPFYVEIFAALVCMCTTYGAAVYAVTPAGNPYLVWILVFSGVAAPFALRGFVQGYQRLRK